ncbi:MAG: hypothetical protein DHS20C19_21790 [Acidimicrobiales bacterium]|nr:MAG: hypothetical protein DHS20C19_21790 [Acidimicrobiales bacterium]
MKANPRRIDAAAVDELADQKRTLLVGVPVRTTKKGRVRKRYEIRIRSHRTAQRVSAVLSAVIVLVGWRWYLSATEWYDPCGSADARVVCEQPDAWFRYGQFWLAMVGMVTGVIVAVYLLRFAWQGRIWRYSREVSLAHGAVVLAWLFVWAIGAAAR